MLKHLASTIKKIVRNKTFSSINIVSLTIGFVVGLIILVWVKDELSYDKFLANSNEIYRIVSINKKDDGNIKIASTWAPIGNAMVQYFPEVNSSTRLYKNGDRILIKNSNNTFFENDIFYADSLFLDMFSFKVLFGNPSDMLKHPYNIVLTKKTALKYFNKTDVIGETLELDNDNVFTISGVIDDLPNNTHLNFSALLSFCSLKNQLNTDNYNSIIYYSYIRINKNTHISDIEEKLGDFQLSLMNGQRAKYTQIALQPIQDIHLYSNMLGEISTNGNIIYVYLFIVVGVIILLVSSINFAILFMAQINKMSINLGIKRIVGASKGQLAFGIWIEILLCSILAYNFAIIIIKIFQFSINQIIGKKIELNFLDKDFLIISLCLILFNTLVSLIYPLLYTLSLKPIRVLKKEFTNKTRVFNSRHILIIFQFLVAISLISSSLIVFSQLHFLQKKDIGFDKNNILCVRIKDSKLNDNIDLIKEELKSSPNIVDVAVSSGSLGKTNYISAFWTDNPTNSDPLLRRFDRIDQDFIPTMKLRILNGRNFSKTNLGDTLSIIVNKKFVNELGWDNPIDKFIYHGGEQFKIIGVVNDFNDRSLHSNSEAFLFTLVTPDRMRYLHVRYSGISASEAKTEINKKISGIGIDTVFESFEMSDTFNQFYTSEQKMGTVLLVFTILIVMISVLGLYGLSQFLTEQKIKEIGIKKVLGASVLTILIELNDKFVKWVLFSILLSFPIVYYYMEKWLDNFEYQILFYWWSFIVSAIIAILVAVFTVSIHAFKYATQNPVKSLKYE